MLNTVWFWLQGKKTTVGTILGLLNAYLFTKGTYDQDTMMLIASILVALGLAANVANARQQ